MILAYTELRMLIAKGVVLGAEPEQVNAASIDVRLGGTFLMERYADSPREVDLARRDSISTIPHNIKEGSSLFLDPGEFCLAATIESFNLPDDISAEFKLKSSIARSGLNQLTAVWCDAGWNGSVLTLELSNVTQHHRLLLTHGMSIGQMVFHRHAQVPREQSYAVRGRYNNDRKVQSVKP